MIDTTIVIPCYNEATRLDVPAFVQHVLTDPPEQFLFVNDGSTDQTLDVLRNLEEYDAGRFSILDLPQNGGKAEAVRQGVLAALERNPRFVGYWDADLATPLDAIEPFRKQLLDRSEVDFIFGARIRMLGRAINRQPHRHYLGRFFATFASLVLRMGIYDTQCGAKLLRVGPTTAQLFDKPFITSWIFDVELIARLIQQRQQAGLSSADEVIYELPLDRWCDVAGSKVRPHDFLKAIGELWNVHRTYLRGWRIPRSRRAMKKLPSVEPANDSVARETPTAQDQSSPSRNRSKPLDKALDKNVDKGKSPARGETQQLRRPTPQ